MLKHPRVTYGDHFVKSFMISLQLIGSPISSHAFYKTPEGRLPVRVCLSGETPGSSTLTPHVLFPLLETIPQLLIATLMGRVGAAVVHLSILAP